MALKFDFGTKRLSCWDQHVILPFGVRTLLFGDWTRTEQTSTSSISSGGTFIVA